MPSKYKIQSESDLIPIFQSNYKAGIDMLILKELFWCLNDKMLNIQEIIVGSIKLYREYLNKISKKELNTYDIQSGGNQHLAIKLVGKSFIKDTLDDTKCEQWFEGRIPDLISSDKSVIIECGDTDPTKILEYFSRKEIKRIIIIPYPDPDIETINGYEFTKNMILNEYITHKKQHFISENKKYITR